MARRTVIVPGNQVHTEADIGSGRIVQAALTIEDETQSPANEPPFNGEQPRDQWERDFQELCALAPINQFPVDVSREAIYGPDPGEPEL